MIYRVILDRLFASALLGRLGFASMLTVLGLLTSCSPSGPQQATKEKGSPAQSEASRHEATKAGPAAEVQKAPAQADSVGMLTVEQCEVSKEPVTRDRFEVTPRKNQVLYICTINFTSKARALTFEQVMKLGFSAESKQMNDFAQKLQWETGAIGPGDLAYRLTNGTRVPCELIPTPGGQSVTRTKPNGRSAFWTTLGQVSAVASVPAGEVPAAVVWGKKYEAPVPQR